MARLLIVEDDANTLTGLQELFRQEGYEVCGARTGSEAISCFSRTHVDLVLCDYMLPDMDGISACSALRSIRPHIPLFILTAFNNADLARQAKQIGVRNVISKPVIIDDLLRIVASQTAIEPRPKPSLPRRGASPR